MTSSLLKEDGKRMRVQFLSNLALTALLLIVVGGQTLWATAPIVTVIIEDISVRKPGPQILPPKTLQTRSVEESGGSVSLAPARSSGGASVFPNPATTQVTVYPDVGTTLVHLKIISHATGLPVLDTSISGAAQHRVGMPTGTYYFQLQTSTGSTITKTVEIL